MNETTDTDLFAPAEAAPSGAAPTRPGWREDLLLAVLLGVVAALATAAVFPYLLDTMPGLRERIHLPMPVVLAAQGAQALVVVGALSLWGLRMTARSGLQLPWLRALVNGTPRPPFPWVAAVASGLAVGALILVASLVVDPFMPTLLHTASTSAATSAWHGFLASFYGGAVEELELRLFAMTALVWLVARIGRKAPGPTAYWFGILGAAILFGVGHLPAAAQAWPLTTLVIARVVVLNAIGGVVFGWLYWKRGLEVAMLAHFSADLVLHVVGPLLPGASP